jgi:exocyst complex component 4
LSKSLNENVASESELCNRLRAKYASAKSPQLKTDWKSDVLSEKFVTTIAEILEALIVFDQLEAAMDALFSRSSVVYNNCVNDTIAILLLTTGTSGTDADSTQFVQLMQTLITQVRSAYKRHEAVSHEISKVRSGDDINNQLINRFWTCIQEVLKSVVNVHLALDISNEEKAGDISTKQKMLFRFDNTTCVSVHSSTSNVQPLSAICQPDPYNIVAIFHLANRFCVEIESKPFISSPCPFNVHLHTVIMDRYFIEHVKRDMEKKTEVILRNSDVWSSSSELPNDGKGILNSCIKIFDLCRHVANLIKSMEIYTQRFASLWLLILEVYTRSASEVYAKITRNQSAFDGENYKEHSKISATWAVDEDISRFLKSLPSWTIFKCSVPSTPSAEMTTPTGLSLSISESEPEIKQRTERESEILIGNLGIEKQIRQEQLITDIEHIKSIACMHKSLQWFVGNMRELMANISPQAKKHMQCRIQMQSAEGGEVSEEILNKALEDRLRSLEEMSETCLLMLHLELRVRCFYHLYPLARSKVSASQDEHDREVVEFRNDMEQLHRLLKDLLPNKVKYLFDGLGHLCASIFIHSSQHMTKLSENGRKRICRNIFTVQKYLSPLTGRTESELNRARTFYELLNKEPDQLLASIMEQGAKFSYLEYNYLLSLAVRSHHLLSSQPGALESKMTQLREILSQLAK